MKFLFIGGSADRLYLEVKTDEKRVPCRTWQVATRLKPAVIWDASADTPVERNLKVEQYECVKLQDYYRRTYVFRPVGSDLDVISTLIDGYRVN